MYFRILLHVKQRPQSGIDILRNSCTLLRIATYAILTFSFIFSNILSTSASSSEPLKNQGNKSPKQSTEVRKNTSKSNVKSHVEKSESSSSSSAKHPTQKKELNNSNSSRKQTTSFNIAKKTTSISDVKKAQGQESGKSKEASRNSTTSSKIENLRSSYETNNSRISVKHPLNRQLQKSAISKPIGRVADIHKEIAPGVRIATRTTMNSSVRAVGQAAEIGEGAGKVAVGLAGKSALYAGQTAVDMAYIPIDLADHLGMSGRKKGPGYEMAAAVISKNRFSRALAPLAGRAVNNHPIFSRRGTFVLNPCPGAQLGRGVSATHDGLDLIAPSGSPIYAALPGRCIYSGREFSGYGNVILIAHGNDLYTLYSHNSQNLISYGQCVNAGQRIALVGNTGRASGPHLHFEMRLDSTPIDPLRYMH